MSTSADDDVAAKSGFLCMYMSSHPDTLTAYIKYQGGVAGAVSAPKLEAINTKNMTLSYIPGKTKTGDRKQVVVAFKPPLSGYNEVKGRMLGMKADAQEALGMIKTPKLTTFQLPARAVLPGIIMWLAFLYLAYPHSPTVQKIISDNLPGSMLQPISKDIDWWAAARLVPYQGTKFIAATIVVIHALESVYTATIVRKHVSGFFHGSVYVLATMLSGFPVWVGLLKRIKQARIDSVMKVE